MNEPANESGLGFFLKSERERKGLSLEHMAVITRLRIQYIEALENEEWQRLPSLVFVKGFIKTYAKALGLDYKDVMGQFQSSVPMHDDLPKPLVPPQKTNPKKFALLLFLVIFILALSAVCIITDPMSHFRKTGASSTGLKEDTAVPNQAYKEDIHPGGPLLEDSGDKGVTTPVNVSQIAALPETPEPETNVNPQVLEPVTRDTAASEAIQIPAQDTTAKPVAEATSSIEWKFSLKAYVTERTYIKVYADDNLPKEYIFSPGSQPQWTGNDGFYLLIGNAGGVEFDFNGTRIKGLGKPGDVVRLRLPENFNLNINE